MQPEGLWAACGAEAVPPVDPCKLVTTTEVENLIDKLKGTPEADQEGEAAWCFYEFTNGSMLWKCGYFLPTRSYLRCVSCGAKNLFVLILSFVGGDREKAISTA